MTIPDDFVAVPLTDASATGVVRLAVLVRRTPDPIAGRLVRLADPVVGRALLGVALDATGAPVGWLRIELASVDAARKDDPTDPTDPAPDADRWAADAHVLAELDPARTIRTGWETEPPAPTQLDLDAWRLVPVSDAPDAEAPANCEPFDPDGARRRVTRLDGIELDAVLEALAGRDAEGLRHGRAPLVLGLPLESANPESSADAMVGDGWLFQGAFGRRARVIESLHLRLRLWADVVRDAATLVERLRRPLLDLSPERITVTDGGDGVGMPRLWTLRARLVTPGRTAVLDLPGAGVRCFVRTSDPGPSIYASGSAGRAGSGRAQVRVRTVEDLDGAAVVTGTLETSERLPDGRNDLIRLELPLRDDVRTVYVRFDAEPGGDHEPPTDGPRRFRSVPSQLDATDREALGAAAGIPLDGVRFAAVPAVGTPDDLYAAGVLGARMLLCDRASDLPVVMDDLLSFASRLARTHDDDSAVGERVAYLYGSDPAWADRLGPGQLRPDDGDARRLVPTDLWCDVLTALVQMLPGTGPDAWCRDATDMHPDAPHRAFDPALDALAALVLRTRSLAVVDWRQNREVAGLLRRVRTGLASSTA